MPEMKRKINKRWIYYGMKDYVPYRVNQSCIHVNCPFHTVWMYVNKSTCTCMENLHCSIKCTGLQVSRIINFNMMQRQIIFYAWAFFSVCWYCQFHSFPVHKFIEGIPTYTVNTAHNKHVYCKSLVHIPGAPPPQKKKKKKKIYS